MPFCFGHQRLFLVAWVALRWNDVSAEEDVDDILGDALSKLSGFEEQFEDKKKELRIHGLPLFSLGMPWASFADEEGNAGLNLFEPRYVWLAKRIYSARQKADEPARFGFAETYPPKPGDTGKMVDVPVDSFEWADEERTTGPVRVRCIGGLAFKILKVWQERPPLAGARDADLFVADVQVIMDHESPSVESWAEDPKKILLSQLLSSGIVAQIVDADDEEAPESKSEL